MNKDRADSTITILGLGNPIRQDEGFGIHVVHRLMQKDEFSEVNLVDGGTDGLALLPLVEEAKYLLVLDAVDAKAKAGTVVSLKHTEVFSLQTEKLSQHQITFQEVLALAHFRNCLPQEVAIIGVQPAQLSWGTELSSTVAATLPQVELMVKNQIMAWKEQRDDKKSVC